MRSRSDAARWLPFLRWPRPSPALLRSEMLAGLTVGLMVVPQGVAYAALAGMPLVTGIYASLLPALVAVLFSASTRLSVGPTALSCLVIQASLTGLAMPGSAQWVALAAWLALLSGALQLLLGLARCGWLLNLVSAPVLMAFTQAAALLIIGSQIGPLLGRGTDGQVDVAALALGLGALLLLVLARRWWPKFPTILVVVLASAAISAGMGLEARGTAVVGALPGGLPALGWPPLPTTGQLQALLVPSLVIALISFLETASSAQIDHADRHSIWDQDQDLIGQGLGKIAAGLSTGFPTSASFSRSALNLYAGARSGWATLFSVLVLALSLWAAMPLLRPVPQSVLAAVVLVAVVGLVQPLAFVRLWRLSRAEAVIAVLSFAATLASAPALHLGVGLGLGLSLAWSLWQRLHPRVVEVGLHADGSLRDRVQWKLPALAPHTLALRMDAALDFTSSAFLERCVADHLGAAPGTHTLCLFAQSINRIDATGLAALQRLSTQCRHGGVGLHLAGLKRPVEEALQRAGLLDGLQLHRTEAQACARLRAQGQSGLG
ncbi:MAG: STAS domain-containing protein [Burkholderiaceae bacterium]|jgi:SulP family sulfate permease|nr:STAS domain-containing protein [Burkholderiaceae bacterium]